MDVAKAVQTILEEIYPNIPEGVDVPANIEVKLFRKSNTAGRAKGIRWMEINSDLAEKYPEQLRDTVIHEFAHLLVHLNYDHRCKPHGQEWQDMMELLGAEPQVSHRMHQDDIQVRRHNTFTYRCACREHQLKAGRHNKHICFGQDYRCRTCGTTLEYVSE